MTTEYGRAQDQHGQPASYRQPPYGQPPYSQAQYGQLRASDQDRERVTSVLQAACAEGRLSQQEYDDRLGLALTAQVHGQLDALVADLVPRPAARGTNALAIASLACGAGQAIFGPLPTIPAVVMGHMARRQIRQTGEDGDGLALAGLILGYAGLALLVIGLAVIVLFAAAIVHVGSSVGGG